MYLPQRINTLFVTIIILVPYVGTSRILVVIPFGAKSHYSAFEPLLLELAKRNHELTVISPFPQKVPIKGITDIDISENTHIMMNALEADRPDQFSVNAAIDSIHSFNSTIGNTTKIFHNPKVKRIITDQNKKFDLVITELFDTDITLMFSHKLNAPNIAVSTCALLPWVHERFGNPDNPSYIPNPFLPYSTNMNFYQRLTNTVIQTMYKLSFVFLLTKTSQRLAINHFGDDAPSLIDFSKQTSLMLVNSHYTLHGSRPFSPNVIEVGGISVKLPKKLPKDLEKFLNESTHGVVYFCMGSMLRAATLPNEKRQALIDVFAKLPQRVLWKWEDENMPGKPDNVKLAKWTPQRDVLAHPNVKLFISHGGLLGTTEAVHSGVPILGMPFYGDQGLNIEAVVANGAGLRLDFKDLNKESLEKAVTELLGNPKYKENAKDLSERFRDRPQTPLETAVYWTEYVIRHKGAPHLRSAAVDLAWYQYLLLDVIAFMILVSVLTLTIIYYTLKFIYNLIRSLFSKPQKSKTKKRKNE